MKVGRSRLVFAFFSAWIVGGLGLTIYHLRHHHPVDIPANVTKHIRPPLDTEVGRGNGQYHLHRRAVAAVATSWWGRCYM